MRKRQKVLSQVERIVGRILAYGEFKSP